jgi:chromosome segregation ATPase
MSKKTLIATIAMIAALAPKEETFSAEVVNEGVWMTEAHLVAVNDQLVNNQTALTQAKTDLDAANAAKKVAEDALTAANTTISANATEIAALKAEVAKLKKEPAEAVTTTTKTEDAPPAGAAATKDKASKYKTSFDEAAASYSGK